MSIYLFGYFNDALGSDVFTGLKRIVVRDAGPTVEFAAKGARPERIDRRAATDRGSLNHDIDRKPMDVFWFLPTHGDSRYLGTGEGARVADFDDFRQIAIAADTLGYEGVLLPTGRSCEACRGSDSRSTARGRVVMVGWTWTPSRSMRYAR